MHVIPRMWHLLEWLLFNIELPENKLHGFASSRSVCWVQVMTQMKPSLNYIHSTYLCFWHFYTPGFQKSHLLPSSRSHSEESIFFLTFHLSNQDPVWKLPVSESQQNTNGMFKLGNVRTTYKVIGKPQERA